MAEDGESQVVGTTAAGSPQSPSCSFCGKSKEEVKRLISGPKVYICDECLALCLEIVEEETEKAPVTEPTPRRAHEIKAFLDEHVVGQEDAKKALAVSVY